MKSNNNLEWLEVKQNKELLEQLKVYTTDAIKGVEAIEQANKLGNAIIHGFMISYGDELKFVPLAEIKHEMEFELDMINRALKELESE